LHLRLLLLLVLVLVLVVVLLLLRQPDGAWRRIRRATGGNRGRSHAVAAPSAQGKVWKHPGTAPPPPYRAVAAPPPQSTAGRGARDAATAAVVPTADAADDAGSKMPATIGRTAAPSAS